MEKISACIIAKNAQSTIKECLDSLKLFDEIVFLDNQSADGTLQIVNEIKAEFAKNNFAQIKILSSEFIGFGALKNLAVKNARNEWIFSIDSDEVLSSEAFNEIKNLKLESSDIIALPRANFYKDTWIKACGWYPDFVWRIFNKNFTRFNENIVHESVMIKEGARKIYLKNTLKHYAYNDIEGLLNKLQRYSTLWARQNKGKKSSPLKAITHGTWTFIRHYFFSKGFLYGYKGLVISASNAFGVFVKYMKLHELNSTPLTCSLIITTYNQPKRLSLVLDSVLNLKTKPLEVLIADDGSTSETREMIEKYAQKFPLIHVWQEDLGFRAARIRNLAINRAKGEYIVIIDGDMILDSEFIGDHLKFARNNCVLNGSRKILNEATSNEILESKIHAPSGFRSILLAKIIYKFSKKTKKYFDKKDFIKGIRSCNMSFFKRDCETINGFNEEFIGCGREDSEFVARFLFNGGELRKLKFCAIASHIWHKESSRDHLKRNDEIYFDTIKDKKTWSSKGLV